MTGKIFAGALLSLCIVTQCFAAPSNQEKANHDAAPATPKTAAKPAQTGADEVGQRIFEANCSRCHATPEGFSSRISNTVVRHMRIRASLSAHDEQELRRFFNP